MSAAGREARVLSPGTLGSVVRMQAFALSKITPVC